MCVCCVPYPSDYYFNESIQMFCQKPKEKKLRTTKKKKSQNEYFTSGQLVNVQKKSDECQYTYDWCRKINSNYRAIWHTILFIILKILYKKNVCCRSTQTSVTAIAINTE